MKYFRIHTYDRGASRWESIVGPPFKTRQQAWKWWVKNPRYFLYIADWEIKEHIV